MRNLLPGKLLIRFVRNWRSSHESFCAFCSLLVRVLPLGDDRFFPHFPTPIFQPSLCRHPLGSAARPYCLPSLGRTGDTIQFFCKNSFIYCLRAFGRLGPNTDSRSRLINDIVKSRPHFFICIIYLGRQRWFGLLKNSCVVDNDACCRCVRFNLICLYII